MSAFALKNNDNRFIAVIMYDIIDDKRRSKMAKLLKGYGYRVQKSVFECRVDSGKYKRLLTGITKLHKEGDLVRVYKLNDFVEINNWGEYLDLVDDDFIIF